MRDRLSALFCLSIAVAMVPAAALATEFRGNILDARTGRPLPARVYLQAPDGRWLFVESARPEGSAVPYREQWVPMQGSVERHTTVSAHEFRIDLAPGAYRLTVERGKEYLPFERTVRMGTSAVTEELRLVRWVDMAARGWYSGETHVHRRLEELPNVVLAEDLNVAFPVTFWTTRSSEPPTTEPSPLRPTPDPLGARKDVGVDPIVVDPTHVLIPRNTEYEIFSVGPKRHLLGAIFILNHRSRFDRGMPPVAPIAEPAHREGALLDLDKHNWPWSLMLVPVARVDLFELANNSVWRTAFGFRSSPVPPPAWMNIEQDAGGLSEWGWLDYGFQTYYALLNCGFPIRPTAGTASGVHPVPLGYGRVYVHLPARFSLPGWIDGLRAGRSFVTTGPMLPVTLDGQDPGCRLEHPAGARPALRLRGEALSARPLERIQVVVNGEVVRDLKAENRAGGDAGFVSTIDERLTVGESSWLAVRCFERGPDGRVRFAHTGPFHVRVGDETVRPRRREITWLLDRMLEEIQRNLGVLDDASLDEYRRALKIYAAVARRARE